MTNASSPHPSLGPLTPLLGTWRGRGQGDYPGIEKFAYLEEIVFGYAGKPFISYSQKTRDAVTDAPLHAETGYLRPGAGGVIEWVIAQPTGIVEVLTGSITEGRFEFASASIVSTPSAVDVSQVSRVLELDGDELSYELHMAAVQQPMQLHLTATLHRVP